jgi:hypothetical protein
MIALTQEPAAMTDHDDFEPPPYRRTRSSGERSTEEIRRQTEAELLIRQVQTALDTLNGGVSDIQKTLVDVQLQLNNGSNRMGQIEKDVAQQTKNLNNHLSYHEEQSKSKDDRWNGIIPAVIVIVLGNLVTAVLILAIASSNSEGASSEVPVVVPRETKP